MRVGESGTGQTVKVCNQIVVALVIEAASEALVLGAKAGVNPAKAIEVLSGGRGGCDHSALLKLIEEWAGHETG